MGASWTVLTVEEKKKKVFDFYNHGFITFLGRRRRRKSSGSSPICTSLSVPTLKEKKGTAFSRRSPLLSCVTRRFVSCQLRFSRCRRAPLAADTVSHRVFQLPRPARRHDCLIGGSYFRGNYYHSDYVNHSGSLLLRVASNSSGSPETPAFHFTPVCLMPI